MIYEEFFEDKEEFVVLDFIVGGVMWIKDEFCEEEEFGIPVLDLNLNHYTILLLDFEFVVGIVCRNIVDYLSDEDW